MHVNVSATVKAQLKWANIDEPTCLFIISIPYRFPFVYIYSFDDLIGNESAK